MVKVYDMYSFTIYGSKFIHTCHIYVLLSLDSDAADRASPAATRLANIYAESKEFLTVKQHLDQKLEAAISEPVGEKPSFATNFFWQVSL